MYISPLNLSQQKQYLQFDYHSFLPAQLRRSILQMLSFYQDRLGTNIATAFTKRRAADCTEQLGADGASYLWCAKHNTTQSKAKQKQNATFICFPPLHCCMLRTQLFL